MADLPEQGKQGLDARLPELLDEASRMAADDPRRRAASIAMFDRVAQHWQLSADERQTLLGGVTKSTWSDWKQRPLSARIRPDTRERIANLFAIDLMTHSIFAPEFADAWVRRPHASFGDESALAVMLRGRIEDVVSVRRHLEGVGAGSNQAQPPQQAAVTPESAVRSLKDAVAILRSLAPEESGRYAHVVTVTLRALRELRHLSGDESDEEAVVVDEEALRGVGGDDPTSAVFKTGPAFKESIWPADDANATRREIS